MKMVNSAASAVAFALVTMSSATALTFDQNAPGEGAKCRFADGVEAVVFRYDGQTTYDLDMVFPTGQLDMSTISMRRNGRAAVDWNAVIDLDDVEDVETNGGATKRAAILRLFEDIIGHGLRHGGEGSYQALVGQREGVRACAWRNWDELNAIVGAEMNASAPRP